MSLIVLFADSLNALFPALTANQWKAVAFLVITPLGFLPLRVLSVSSILGILCTFGLLLVIAFDGVYKVEAPGSLWEPANTWLWPRNGWVSVAKSIGIFMAPWGGHAVFPNIYRDMRHPEKYVQCINVVYKVTFLVDLSVGVFGFLMFGAQVLDEVTKNILMGSGYPVSLNFVVVMLSALIPVAKTPLNARPIIHTVDSLFGANRVLPLNAPGGNSRSNWIKMVINFINRVSIVLLVVVLAVLFPEFDRVLGVLGAFLGTLVCLILPASFYLRIFHGKIAPFELAGLYTLLTVSAVVAVIGTIYSVS
jgi:vesicular inhibitory amino acid transporter